MQIVITGTRNEQKLNEKIDLVSQTLEAFLKKFPGAFWHVGDCPRGVDRFVFSWICDRHLPHELYRRQGNERWHFAERSVRMVRSAHAIADETIMLAFPDKERQKGSGTWLTIGEAEKLGGIDIKIFPLFDSQKSLTTYKQLTLF